MSEPALTLGDIPDDDIYEVLSSYRDYREYVESVCTARVEYDSAHSDTTVVAEGSVLHVGGGDFHWWLGFHDDERDRTLALDMSHDRYGNEQWEVVSDDGRTLGPVESLTVESVTGDGDA